jgi:hypothetical protein
MRYFRSWLFDIGLALAALGTMATYFTVSSVIPLWLGEGGIGSFSVDMFVSAASVAFVGFALLVLGAIRVRRGV